MRKNFLENMSIPSPEISSSVFCKGEGEISNADNGKDKRCLKKPSPISARQKINSKTNVGFRSVSKLEVPENNLSHRSTSKSRTRSSSIGNNGSRLTRACSVSSASSNSQKRILENQYLTKKNRYNILRRDLENKHKVAVEMYEEVLQLRNKAIEIGGKDPGKPEEVGLSLSSEQDKRFNCNATSASEVEEPIEIPECEIDSEFMENIELNLQSMPEAYIAFCKEVLNERMKIVSWLTDFGREDCDNDLGLNEKIDMFQKEDNDLIEKLERTNIAHSEIILNLAKKFGGLWTECQSYRSKLRNIRSAVDQNLLEEKLKNLSDALEAEREKSQKLKERKTQLENQMPKLKSKLKELEVQVSNGESKTNQLQNSVKQLESQVKQKETSLEQRTKEMQKISKSNESVINKLEKQKEILESRLSTATTDLSNKDLANDALQKTLKELEERLKELDREQQLRLQMEDTLGELQKRNANLEKKNKDLAVQLAEKANSSVSEQAKETRLCNALEDAKSTIKKQEERIDELHREREELIAAMKRASGHEANEEKQNKLMADLSRTTNELKNFKDENLQLKKNLKSAVSKGESVQKQLSELHSRLQNQCKESGKADWSALIIDLQQQNSDLKCTLNEFARQNKKLEAELSQKQVELECIQHNQGTILKAREEMKNNNKSPKLNGEKKEGRELKQVLTKSEELQEIYIALKGKQMRIMQLEKMLKQMEEQQDRAQAQRTRLESRIAQLEISAKEKTHRYVVEQNVPLLNLENSSLNATLPPPVLLQPTTPPLLPELHISSHNKRKSNYSPRKKSPRVMISPRGGQSQSFVEKGQCSTETNNRFECLNKGGGHLKSPRLLGLGAANTEEALAYEMHETRYDWLLKPSMSPRFAVDFKRPLNKLPALKNDQPTKGCRKPSSSKESLFRGYKKRSFRFNRPYCDYQSPRKPTPSIRVRQYTV